MSDETTALEKEAEAKSFSERLGFTFYLFHGERYQQRGWKSETRPATDEEKEMWTALGGPHAYTHSEEARLKGNGGSGW